MKLPGNFAPLLLAAATTPLLMGQLGWLSSRNDDFTPKNRLSGIGVDRQEMSDIVLAKRTELMIESQTFSIMRDPQALQGAARITNPKMKKIFRDAANKSGMPANVISAVAYLESWGDPRAESPAGPKGIMQFSEATARRSGLKIVRATRYRVTSEKKRVKTKRGMAWRTVKHKVPYTVTVRDERMQPEKAIPAAAIYLSEMEKKFGGRDWAVFAYHCGEGCVSEFQAAARETNGLGKGVPSVAKVFFAGSPARNKELYHLIRHHMDRDYSPTYWFRIMRASQLLDLYESDPEQFKTFITEYRNDDNPTQRAPHRLSVWLRAADFAFHTCDDIRKDQGHHLVKAFDDPKLFGFTLRKAGAGAIGEDDLRNQEYYLQASPAAIGTLAYIAFETRRLHAAMKPKGETFVPLEVTGLVRPMESTKKLNGYAKTETISHCTGQVFDIALSNLPNGEREALQFVLDDLGWNGYLGFVEESPNSGTLHVGCSPTSRDFFTRVFEEAANLKG